MTKKLTLSYELAMEGHAAVGLVDAEFYRALPNNSEEYRDRSTGTQVTPLPTDIPQLVTVAGSAVLSSGALATVIKTWLESKRRKIVITFGGTGDKIEYEGPGLAEDAAEIEAMIERHRGDSDFARVQATYLPDDDSDAAAPEAAT
jgi:hypothetical protein